MVLLGVLIFYSSVIHMQKRKQKQQLQRRFFDDLSPQTKQAIGAVGFVVLGIFFTLSLFNYAGMVGSWTNTALDFLFGSGAYLAPFVCGFYVYALLNPKEDEHVSTSKIIGISLIFFSSLAFLALYKSDLGGIIGSGVEVPLSYLAGRLASGFIIGALLLVGLFLTFNSGLFLPHLFKRKKVEELDEDIENIELPKALSSEAEHVEDETSSETNTEGASKQKSVIQKLGLSKEAKETDFIVSSFVGKYAPPPLSLLKKDT